LLQVKGAAQKGKHNARRANRKQMGNAKGQQSGKLKSKKANTYSFSGVPEWARFSLNDDDE
jgi:hypothetical protein